MINFKPEDCHIKREFVSGSERWRHIVAKATKEDGSEWAAASNFPETEWATAHEVLAKCARMTKRPTSSLSERARLHAETLCYNASYPGSARSTVGMKPMRAY